MFRREQSSTATGSALAVMELVYHGTVRNIRRSQGNAVLGLLRNIFQTVLLILTFYFLMTILGMRHAAIRGDFVLYIMTGIFLFMTHTRAMGAVFGSESPTSAIMKHAPMTTAVSIASAALGALYLQLLSATVILYVYHAAFVPITIDNWVGTLGMLLLSWFTGVAFGVLFLAMKPWAPGTVAMIQQVYARTNMITSGKMFLANTLPHKTLVLFDWNPLFHTIDQSRGYAFINYNPHFSNWHYPLWFGVAVLMLGLMGEFYTRQRASISWSARR